MQKTYYFCRQITNNNKPLTLTLKHSKMGLLFSIIVGAVAGWLAGKIMRGGGFGFLINLLLGLVGGAVGGWLFTLLGINWDNGWIGQIGTGVVGAVVVLWVASLFKK